MPKPLVGASRKPSSKVHVRIPHGCYVLKIQDPAAWFAIKYGLLVRGIPFVEKPYVAKSMAKTHPVVSEADLLLIVATNPGNRRHMKEIHNLLGISI